MIDIQASTFIDASEVRSIDNMPGYRDRMLAARGAIDAARAADIPVTFIQEVHRPDLVDFGREGNGFPADRSSHPQAPLLGLLWHRS